VDLEKKLATVVNYYADVCPVQSYSFNNGRHFSLVDQTIYFHGLERGIAHTVDIFDVNGQKIDSVSVTLPRTQEVINLIFISR